MHLIMYSQVYSLIWIVDPAPGAPFGPTKRKMFVWNLGWETWTYKRQALPSIGHPMILHYLHRLVFRSFEVVCISSVSVFKNRKQEEKGVATYVSNPVTHIIASTSRMVPSSSSTPVSVTRIIPLGIMFRLSCTRDSTTLEK